MAALMAVLVNLIDLNLTAPIDCQVCAVSPRPIPAELFYPS